MFLMMILNSMFEYVTTVIVGKNKMSPVSRRTTKSNEFRRNTRRVKDL